MIHQTNGVSRLSAAVVAVVAEDAEVGMSSHVELGWPIELFLQTPESIVAVFEKGRRTRWPLLLNMCAEARMVIDRSGVGAEVQSVARGRLAEGPALLSDSEIDWYRYNLTWMLDDAIDGADPAEVRFMVHDLVVTSIEAALHRRRAWLGKGKWLIRNLRLVDPVVAARIVEAQRVFGMEGEAGLIVSFAEEQLEAIGGRKFEGLSGKW